LNLPSLPENIGGIYLEKLAVSIIVDLIGMGRIVLPVIGVISSPIWAPISAFIIWLLYREAIAAGIGFIEELGTVTSIIPTATLAWVYVVFIKR